MIEFIAIDKSGECNPLKVQQLSWEEHDGKLRLFFHGISLDDYYSEKTPKVISGFLGDNEESKWMLCQVIKP
jgi:hypothetical protein